MKNNLFDLYSDYLLCSFNQTSATKLSDMVSGRYSHDQITRFLANNDFSSKTLWKYVKPKCREIEKPNGVLIFDDTVQEKQYSNEDDVICWHFDHVQNRSVKGVNLLNCVYHVDDITIPVAYELITKQRQCDLKTRKEVRKSQKTKNKYLREMLRVCCKNHVQFKYVLTDNWFSSKANMLFIRNDCNKDFILAMKSNRLIFLKPPMEPNSQSVRIDLLPFTENMPIKAWIKGVDFPVLLHRQIFINKDGSKGIIYLACSDLSCDGLTIETTYQKRWAVEVFHKTLKSHCCMAKSPASSLKTKSNHIFMSIYSAFKLECLSIKQALNHFQIKGRLYLKAIQAAFTELRRMRDDTA